MKKGVLGLILILFYSSLSAQSNKNHGLLWEITGPSLEAPSYLYGTMHVSKKIAFHLSDSFFIALDNVDLIALESDPGKWMSEMYKSKTSMSLNGYQDYVRKTGDGNFYENLTAINNLDNEKIIDALRKNHALQNGYLYRSSRYNEEYEENTYLDLFIYQYAKKNKKEVLNLEDYEETNKLEILSNLPDEEQILKSKQRKRDKSIKADKRKKSYYSYWNDDKTVAEAMEDAYREGDIFTIDSISTLTARSKNYLKYFLYDRNRIMVRGIDSLLKTKKTFIGIGAAHLAGDEGVLNLLEQKGYKVRPVEKSITQLAKNKKNDIDDFHLNIPYKSFTTKDGYLSMNVPNELYETPGEDGELQYFFPDMINGGYFFISRYSTFSFLHDKTAKDLLTKTDSLLFENIEGKIKSQKKTKVSGYDAIDVTNETRKGDLHRRLIVFTEFEVIIFKMAGIGNWTTQFGDQFFNSIRINKSEQKETSYNSSIYNYELNFPHTPISNIHATSIAKPGGYTLQAFNPKDSAYYLLFNDYLNSLTYIEEDSFEVVYSLQTFFEKFDDIKNDTTFIDSLNHKVAYGNGTLKNGKTIFAKCFQKRNLYFVLVCLGSSEKAQNYFDSFKWQAFKEDKFETLVDTNLGFSVSTNVKTHDLTELYKKVKSYKSESDKEPWASNNKNRFFFNDKTLEGVSVYVHKFSDYYSISPIDSFWVKELKRYKNQGFVTLKKVVNNNDTLPFVSVLLGDTNSTKVVRVKKILNGDILFTIKSNYDSLFKTSKFIENFYSTFHPLNLNKEKSILNKKASLFFSDLASNDSIRELRALDLYNNLRYSEKDVDSIIWAINEYEFPKDKEEAIIEDLLKEIGYLKNTKSVPFLINKYSNLNENYKQQISVLKALSRNPSKKTFKQLKKLLIEETPISSSNYAVKSLFYYLEDSLKLSKSFFPDAYDLLLYDEYRKPIIKLTNLLLDSNLIHHKSYKRQKNFILREAKKIANEKVSSYSKNKGLGLKDKSYTYKFSKKVYFQLSPIREIEINKYLNLLAPYYSSDQRVKQFFNAIVYDKENEKNRLSAVINLSKNGVTLRDSIYSNFSKSDKFSIAYYKALKLIGRTDLFKQENNTQLFLSKSSLYCTTKFDPLVDTLEFLQKEWIDDGKNKGYVYFFLSEASYGNYWYLNYAGIQPLDSSKTSTLHNELFIESKKTIYSKDKIQTEIQDLVKQLNLNRRERSSQKRSYYFN